MEARCKKCGRSLRDPVSIARGMGPKCAGISHARKSFRPMRSTSSTAIHPFVDKGHATLSLFSFNADRSDGVPETLKDFPPDLVNLVLSAPAPGAISARVKLYSYGRPKQNGVHPATILKQIRRMCIELRLLFWPGLFVKLEPIPCIPYGENDWKMGENGKVLSRDELVAYLSRYEIISSQ